MIITDFAIDRRTTVVVLLLLILVVGVVTYTTLPRESEPEVVIPIAMVSVVYEGVSPEDMETLVTMPIERKLTGISGVKEMKSTSREGMSTVIVEFEPDVDVDNAVQKVKDKVDQAKPDLPDEVEEPIISDVNSAESPIIFVNITGPLGLMELSKLAEELEDRVEALPGIMEVEILGDIEREIHIIVDPVRLAHYGVSLADLVQITQTENVNTPAGSMDVGEAKYLMRVPSEITSPDELQNLVVKRGETGIVYMRDLALIQDGFKEPLSYSRLDGMTSVTLVASKRAGVNIIKVADNVKEILKKEQANLPEGVSLNITLDESERIRQMVHQLENSILTGLVLVLIVIFAFLGFSNAVFVALAIPVSMLIAFIFMSGVGITLNMVSLFSLMVALGMLVDNGIVVVENIHRHAQSGLTRVAAAKKGAAEVAWPIIGSTMTTVAAFFPMIFWPGMMGRFMNLLPKTVIITLMGSLFVGLVVNPALASVFTRVGHTKPALREYNWPASWIIGFGRTFKNALKVIFFPIQIIYWPIHFLKDWLGEHIMIWYEKVLATALHWRMVTVVMAVTLLVTIIGVFASKPSYEFLSEAEPDRAYVNIELPEGSNLDVTDVIARHVEDITGSEREYLDFLMASVGSHGANVREGMPGEQGAGTASHIGRVTMVFPTFDNQKEVPSTILQRIRNSFDHIVGAEIRMGESTMGPSAAPPINIELTGEDFDVLAELTQEIEDRMERVPGLVDLVNDLDKGKPEVRVIIDKEHANLANLNSQFIGMTVQAAIHGRKAAEYREGDDEYDVIVKFPDEFREDLSHIEGMSLINLEGRSIPFSTVARLEEGASYGSIKRIDRKRTVSIEADAKDGVSSSDLLAAVQDSLSTLEMPAGYALTFTGENEDVNITVKFMFKAFIVALFLIALVLITQFNSLIQPMIIMSSVFLSLGGVFLGLIIFDMPFGVLMTGIGCISLSGIVVNNAIVLVDFINNLREQGMATEEAILEAGKTRFRPVLLTAVTTILGLMPLGMGISFDFRKFELIYGGDQTSYWGAMAIAIIFGLAFATVLTLIVVPILYSFAASFEQVFKPQKRKNENPAYPDVI